MIASVPAPLPDDGLRSCPREPLHRVTAILATRNGAANLRAQLDSYLVQTMRPARLIVSDDGSTDETSAILAGFVAAAPGFPVDLGQGPGRGAAQNFLHLIRCLPEDTDMLALSDQDDVWLPGKLERGVARLAALPPGQPGLLGSRAHVCDARLTLLHATPLPQRPLSFRHALVQNFAGGNSMMLNRAAVDLLRAAAGEARRVVVHDWWIYQIISGAGGTVIYHPEPLLLYRQHGVNLIGANAGMGNKLRRLRGMLNGRLRRWNAINLAALRASTHRLTPENRMILEGFSALQQAGPIRRLRILRRLGLYRQGIEGTMSLWLAALLGRL